MSNSNVEDEESGENYSLFNLEATPGSAEETHRPNESVNNDKQNQKYHKNLAIFSFICGCSCFAYKALEYYFKGAHKDKKEAEEYFKKSKKYSIIALVTGIGIVISIPILIVLISYLLTLND